MQAGALKRAKQQVVIVCRDWLTGWWSYYRRPSKRWDVDAQTNYVHKI